MNVRSRILACAAALTAAACDNPAQSALHPGGALAGILEKQWWTSFSVFTAVFIIVMVFLALALRRSVEPGKRLHRFEPDEHRLLYRVVFIAVVVTAVILLSFLVLDLSTGRALAAAARRDRSESIEVTGYQWWWQLRYTDSLPSNTFTTANELHIPTRQPVRLVLRSTDVIHSFWVPGLHGKKDLIPGYVNELWLEANRAGVYYGQCAEFCGHQHANMRLVVVAHDSVGYRKWKENERSSARSPVDTLQQRGLRVFLDGPCVLCHTIGGTDAAGKTGPDLTHVGSRRRLAAGAIPHTRGYLGGWILDPQSIKPGTKMPPNPLSSQDLRALLAYLESLK